MDTNLKPQSSMQPARLQQKGFSMVEMLMAAFILAIGLLGLSMLQVMSVRSNAGSRMQTLAIGVGQNILETIDAEARQQRLFRTLDPSNTTSLTSYFGAPAINGTYSIYGTPVNTGSSDPLEQATVFTTTSNCTQDVTGGSAVSGRVYSFTIVVSFVDGINSSGAAHARTQTFRRKVTL